MRLPWKLICGAAVVRAAHTLDTVEAPMYFVTLFSYLDADGDWVVSARDIKERMAKEPLEEQERVSKAFAESDKDRDGILSFEEELPAFYRAAAMDRFARDAGGDEDEDGGAGGAVRSCKRCWPDCM
mmetsp:Transcript_83416/g.236667  ORF Transcript_83416/g.236667 Transcript_83416/m.236667 type:complete len:127 (+) Transcript_83416:137-517(+)